MKEKFINKPLFNLQRKSNLKLSIIFSVVVAFLVVVAVALFPMIETVADQIPEELREFLFMGSITDYFGLEAMEMWILVVGIYVSVLAINLTTKEFKNGSYELIYSLNMSRGEIVRTKLLRLLLNTIYINLVAGVVSLIALLIVAPGQFSVINLAIYTLFAILVTMQIAIIAFALGLIVKKKFSTATGVFVVVAMYLITTLSTVTGNAKLDWLGYLSPLSTMKDNIIANGFAGIFSNGITFGIWSAISIVVLFVATRKFKNDDLC